MENEMNVIEERLRIEYAKLFNTAACVFLVFVTSIAMTVWMGKAEYILPAFIVMSGMISSFYLMKKMFNLFDLWGSVVMMIILLCASYSKIAGYVFSISMLLLNLYLIYEFVISPIKNLRFIRNEYDTKLTFTWVEILINIAHAILDKLVIIIQIIINYIISFFRFIFWPFTLLLTLFA